MQSSLYVAVSAQLALQRRLDTIAHNVANAPVAGFRAEEVKFEALVSPNTQEPVAFASTGRAFITRKAGELTKTGDAFDTAIRGDAWFAINTPSGPVYTRDGRFRMLPTGDLQTLNGYAALDTGGAAIQLNPQGGVPTISADGAISQGGRRVAALGLFRLPDDAKLSRFDNSGVLTDKPATPMLDFASANIVQGYTEASNVNPIAEMSRLILVQRTFDAASLALSTAENALQGAIRSLGSST